MQGVNVSQNTLSLKVLEAYTRDVGRGVARIDYDSMDSLGASTGDVIEIRGKRRTVAKCLPLYPSDEGKGIIRVDGLTKTYVMGDVEVRALRGVSFEVRRGELMSIMGPSGSGKSTLMNILGCLDRPSSGSYLFDGQDVSHLSPDERAALRNRKIGFVFQSFNLLPRTTALENIALPLVYSDLPESEHRPRAEQRRHEVRVHGHRHARDPRRSVLPVEPQRGGTAGDGGPSPEHCRSTGDRNSKFHR